MIHIYVYAIDILVVGVALGSPMETFLCAHTYYMEEHFEKDPRYQLGYWDGRCNLFSAVLEPTIEGYSGPLHRIPTGMLVRLTNLLTSCGAEYQIYSGITPWAPDPALVSITENPISLRPYQTEALFSMLVGARLAGNASCPRLGGIIQVATGGGKSRVSARLIQMMQVRTVFLVNQIDLMTQTIEEFERLLGCKVGRVGDNVCDIQPVTVATVQTVEKAVNMHLSEKALTQGIENVREYEKKLKVRQMMLDARLVICDEVHGVAANTAYAAVASAKNACSIVGLSASPWRDDGLDLLIEAAVGTVRYAISASELISLGFLVQPDIVVHNLPEPEDRNPDRMLEPMNAKFYTAWVVSDHKRNSYTAALARQYMEMGEIVLILVKRVEHGKRLQELIQGSMFMEGKLNQKKRKELIDSSRSGELRCLIATSLADQGLDIPRLSTLILAGGGKSSTKALQRIGRILRIAEGKTRAYVHDLVDNQVNFKRQYSKRMSIYKSESAFRIHICEVR